MNNSDGFPSMSRDDDDFIPCPGDVSQTSMASTLEQCPDEATKPVLSSEPIRISPGLLASVPCAICGSPVAPISWLLGLEFMADERRPADIRFSSSECKSTLSTEENLFYAHVPESISLDVMADIVSHCTMPGIDCELRLDSTISSSKVSNLLVHERMPGTDRSPSTESDAAWPPTGEYVFTDPA